MPRNIYSPEFKMSIIDQYYKRDCSSHEFAKRHEISYITLTNWITKYRKHEGITEKSQPNSLINVTQPIKEIVRNENRNISLKINNLCFTFDVSNLKAVIEALKNDWFK